MPEKPTAFVLMPFDETFSSVYEDLIKGPLAACGFEVTRADSLFNQQQILKDVVKGIADATLVVADLTGLNGNVLYELGLAHALGKRTVLITQKLEELPFDLRPYRANEYSTMFNRAGDLKTFLTEIGHAVLDGSADFSNPVQDFAPHALGSRSEALAPPSSNTRGGISTVPEEDAPGWLEALVGVERSGAEATAVTKKIGEHTEAIGAKITLHTERLNRAQANLGDRAAGANLAIARDVASDLDAYATAIPPLTEMLREALRGLVTGTNAIAHHGNVNDDSDAEAIEDLVESLRGAEEGMASGREGILGFARAMLDMPHVDRRLTTAARRVAEVVTETAEEIETAESELARARGLLQERVQAYRDAG